MEFSMSYFAEAKKTSIAVIVARNSTKRMAVVAALWFSKWGNGNGDNDDDERGGNRFFFARLVFKIQDVTQRLETAPCCLVYTNKKEL
jgi:hypothetical protein